MKKLTNVWMLISLIGISGFLVSCGDEENGPNTDGEISSQNDPDLIADDLQGDVTGDITLDAATEWYLTGPLSVKSGATLTIEAGTTISAAVGGTDVYIVIETGAKIMAEGTSSNPITFTSSASNPRNGDWGGVVINGLAPISGGGTSITEVLPLSYGGTTSADNSGILEYVIIEYTGARINAEKEFNGLTLYAVGSGTTINNIMINGGEDDGIEFFGGSVVVDNLLVINAKDDMFDWTQGFTGGGTNWYGIREDGFTDVSDDTRGIEADGNLDGNNPEFTGQSNPTIDKVTLVHDAAAPAVTFADMVKLRRGTGVTLTNLMVAITGAGAAFSDMIDTSDAKGAGASTLTVTYWVNNVLAANANPTDNNNAAGGTITYSSVATGATTSAFAWTGYTFPTLTAASDNARK